LSQLQAAIIGAGFVGRAHIDALRRLVVPVLGVVGSSPERSESSRSALKLERAYHSLQELAADPEVHVVHICTPNHRHFEQASTLLRAGKHVLCEKPMAVTEAECERMIDACRENNVKLMIAYRLYFEKANLGAIAAAKSGKLGDLRFFDSTFSYQVREGNIRTRAELGGGPVYDIGIYCINAARNLFRDEPTEVFAFGAKSDDPRFREIDETVAVTMRFPNHRVATFVCSFGSAATSYYDLVGTKGSLCLDNAFEYKGIIEQWLTIGDRTIRRRFPKADQFAPELLYFSDCIVENREPEPSGKEGLADVRIVRAIHRSIQSDGPVKVAAGEAPPRAEPSQASARVTRPYLPA